MARKQMLQIASQYPETIWVAIMFYHPNCPSPDGGNWEKRGWYSIKKGQLKTIYGGDLSDVNRYWCLYGESEDGETWAGPYMRFLPYKAFRWCEWTTSGEGFTAGFFVLDIDNEDDTIFVFAPR
jgi:hypothetical protein